MFILKIITPNKVIFDDNSVESVTLPTATGEITVLPKHIPLFTLLKEGVVEVKKKGGKEYFAIGGGYFETDGEKAILLVSRAFGQDEINQKLLEQAIKQAEETLKKAVSEEERKRAQALLRRSLIDRDLFYKLQKRRKRTL